MCSGTSLSCPAPNHVAEPTCKDVVGSLLHQLASSIAHQCHSVACVDLRSTQQGTPSAPARGCNARGPAAMALQLRNGWNKCSCTLTETMLHPAMPTGTHLENSAVLALTHQAIFMQAILHNPWQVPNQRPGEGTCSNQAQSKSLGWPPAILAMQWCCWMMLRFSMLPPSAGCQAAVQWQVQGPAADRTWYMPVLPPVDCPRHEDRLYSDSKNDTTAQPCRVPRLARHYVAS
jgi:hypothetical protein